VARTCGLALCVLLLGVPVAAQTIVQSFDGDRGPGRAVCDTGVMHCGSPDMDVAVNGKLAVQVTWQTVRVYDLTGRLLVSTPMTAFVRNAGLDPIPPPRQGRANAAGVLTALDPTDGRTLWTTQQWGGDAVQCVWTTRIVGYRIGPS